MSLLPVRLTTWNLAAAALFAVALSGCGSSDSPSPDPDGQQGPGSDPPSGAAGGPAQPAPADADDLMRRMAAAYKKAGSYADAGRVRLTAEVDGEKEERVANFSVTLRRPNQLRVEAYQAMIVSDGKTLQAALNDLPGQVMRRDAPDEITLDDLAYDRVLTEALINDLAGAFAGSPPQLPLLLADNPAAMLLQGVENTTLLEPAAIDDHPCYRLQIERTDGKGVFWIDQRTLALRRFEYPAEELRRTFSQRGGTVGAVTLVAEFDGAQFDKSVDPVAFQFEVPAGAELVDFFIPPHPANLLGKKVPEFQLVDLAGNPITPATLAGKVAVLTFWASGWKPSLDSLQEIAPVHAALAQRQDIVWMAAAVDPPEISSETLQTTLDERSVRVPIVRDPQQHWNMVFNGAGQLPMIVLIDAKGVVQDFHIPATPEPDQQKKDLATELATKLRNLLAGQDIYQVPLAEYQRQLDEYRQWLKQQAEQEPAEAPATMEIPRATIAAKSQPQRLRLTPLFTCTDLQSPGNIAVLRGADGKSRLLVVEGWRKIAEVGLDGKILSRHDLDIDPKETVTKLRTAVDRSGRLFLAAFAPSEQRVHLLDDSLNKLFSFPENALENPHQGISDVSLADLDADGTLEAYVGYWGVVGLQRVGLDGQRAWSNRKITDVSRLALGAADDRGQRHIFCTNNSGSLAQVDATGQLLGQLAIRNRGLHWAVAADLTGQGQPQWCGLAATPEHRNVAVGFDITGKELWNYPLPLGVHERQIEEIVAGHLVPGAVGQWILPAGDGSIHILSHDGKPIDQFNCGARLTGLATAELDGRGVLVVSTDKTLEAWTVE